MLDGKQWKPHKIQGWTPDFMPSVLDRAVCDEVIAVADDRAIACARDLGRLEGIFCSISGAARWPVRSRSQRRRRRAA